MTILSHKNDVFQINVREMNQEEIIEALGFEGYRMGKSSLARLLSGEIDEACGFVLAESETAPLPDEVVDIQAGISQVEELIPEDKNEEESVEETEEEDESAFRGWNAPVVDDKTFQRYQKYIAKGKKISYADFIMKHFKDFF